MSFITDLDAVLEDMRAFLLEKNTKYGNSALNPLRVFSKASPDEQLKVRMDDKISRIQTAAVGDEEDAVQDLLGYLILAKVWERQHGRADDAS